MLSLLLIFCFIIILTLFIIKYYFQNTNWCRSKTCLVGKTVIITGANTGIGFETALDFAKRGAKVILACRNEEKALKARDVIIEETGNNNILVKIINLASFESVRNFAREINSSEDRLDILVNNAGAVIGDKRSKDDHVLLMQVNYFSSFLLTHLLTDLLKKSAPSRIVNVSSILAKYAQFDLDDLDKYSLKVYSNSKLCNICFTVELAKRLRDSGVSAFSLHPGAVKTDIFRKWEGIKLIEFIKDNFFKTSEEGAQTTIYCSVTKGLEKYSGQHFYNCEKVDTYNNVKSPSNLPQKLWEKTLEIVQLKTEEIRI